MAALSLIALEAIRVHSPAIEYKLALALKCSEASINRYIREKSDELTKYDALTIIEGVTGLTIDEIVDRD